MSNDIALYSDVLTDKRFAGQWNAARFDRGLKFAVERRYIETLLARRDKNGNNMLLECTPQSLQVAALDAAASGLSLSPTLNHAYLVPYRPTVTFTPGYRGLIHLGMRGGTLKSVQANLVYAQDRQFRVWTDEHGRHIEHEESRGLDRGAVTHSYCIAHFMNGGYHIEVLNAEELAACEAAGKAKGGAVWGSKFKGEMQKKCAIRRGSKSWPLDPEGHLRHMMDVVDKHEPMDFERAATPAGGEIVVNEDQIKALHAAITDFEIEPSRADEWLLRTAQARSYARIEQLPAGLFEEVKLSLVDRAKQYVARRDQGAAK